MRLLLMGVALAMLVTTSCGGRAKAQDMVLAADILQAYKGTVILGEGDSECRILADPTAGVSFRDPNGVNLVNPMANATNGLLHTLRFGEQNVDTQGECSIAANPNLGMIFTDPNGFTFRSGVQVEGDVIANSFVQESGRALKTNIRPIADALQRIARLQGVYFDWKPEKGGDADVGFVAEAVAEVLPQAVTRDAATGRIAGVKYANVVALAVEGIKAQQNELDRLTAENRSLRTKVDAMEARLERLLARLVQLEQTR